MSYRLRSLDYLILFLHNFCKETVLWWHHFFLVIPLCSSLAHLRPCLHPWYLVVIQDSWVSLLFRRLIEYWIGSYLGKGLTRKSIFFVKPGNIWNETPHSMKIWGKDHYHSQIFPIIRTYAPFLAGVGRNKLLEFCHLIPSSGRDRLVSIFNYGRILFWVIFHLSKRLTLFSTSPSS